jgi:hypothetical protein
MKQEISENTSPRKSLKIKVKVKKSHYRLGQPLRVPAG